MHQGEITAVQYAVTGDGCEGAILEAKLLPKHSSAQFRRRTKRLCTYVSVRVRDRERLKRMRSRKEMEGSLLR